MVVLGWARAAAGRRLALQERNRPGPGTRTSKAYQMSSRFKADSFFRDAIDARELVGVAAVAIHRDRALYEGVFGRRVVDQDAAMDLDTVVWLASMTKALTSTAALQLVEQGRLDLDAPLQDVVPQIAGAQVLEGFDAAGQPRTRPPKRPITLRHLLTHTAGFGYEYWSQAIQNYRKAQKLPGIASCQNSALRAPLLFDPGERWEYGINIDWVGKVIEAVVDQRLGQYLSDNVLAPLGMHDTGFKISPSMRERLAKIHQRANDGKLSATNIEVPQQPEFEMGGGGLYGTARDYIKFIRMILHRGELDGRRVLQEQTVDLMTRNQIGALRTTPLRSVVPLLSNDFELFPGVEKHFGFGFQINSQPAPTGLPAGSLTWVGLANTYFWIDPAQQIGGVFLTQVLPFADAKALSLFLEFQKSVYEAAGSAASARGTP